MVKAQAISGTTFNQVVYPVDGKNKDILSCFIDYWDEVTRQFYAGKGKLFCEEERFWLKAIDPKLTALNSMPEPYYGNPWDSSMVIVNLNPQGNMTVKHSSATPLNGFVISHKFSDWAKPFYLLDEEVKLTSGMKWVSGLGGYDWWYPKKFWAKQFTQSEKKPFNIELCAWPSMHWRSQMESAFRKSSLLKDIFLKVLYEATSHSELRRYVVCMGSSFKNILPAMGFHPYNGISSGRKPGKKEKLFFYEWKGGDGKSLHAVVVVANNWDRFRLLSGQEHIALKEFENKIL